MRGYDKHKEGELLFSNRSHRKIIQPSIKIFIENEIGLIKLLLF